MDISNLTADNSTFDDYTTSEHAMRHAHSSPKYHKDDDGEALNLQDPFPDETFFNNSKMDARNTTNTDAPLVNDVFWSRNNSDASNVKDPYELSNSQSSNALVIDEDHKQDTEIRSDVEDGKRENVIGIIQILDIPQNKCISNLKSTTNFEELSNSKEESLKENLHQPVLNEEVYILGNGSVFDADTPKQALDVNEDNNSKLLQTQLSESPIREGTRHVSETLKEIINTDCPSSSGIVIQGKKKRCRRLATRK